MRVLVISNLYDILYDELDTILIDKKDEYDSIIFLGNIDINTLKYIKYVLSKNRIVKYLFGVEGNDDIEGTLESIGIKNIHLKYKSLDKFKFAGFSGALTSDEPSTHPTYTQVQAYELLEKLEACDVLISHSSPSGYEENIMDLGFGALTDYIKVKKPFLCIHSNKYSNMISYYKDTYIIGINGMSIIDFELFTVDKLY